MANPSLQIGNSNWAIKEDNLLGYSTAGTRFVPQPITMTRASAGTRVNSEGLVETVELLGSEEITNGDFATDLSGWIDSTSDTFEQVSSWQGENGNMHIVTSAANRGARQTGVYTVGVLYKFTAKLWIVSGGVYFGKNTDKIGGIDYTTTGEWIDINVIFNPSTDDTLRVYTVGAGEFYLDNISVKESTKNNLARVDYDGTASSLLVEPERTNLLTYSEDFSNAAWTKTGSSVVSGFVSPSGELNAYTLTEDTSNGQHKIDPQNISLTNGSDYTCSIFAKKGLRDVLQMVWSGSFGSSYVNFDLTNATFQASGLVTGKIETFANGWYKCTITQAAAATGLGRCQILLQDNISATRFGSYQGNGSGNIFIAFAQVEAGSYATSYIPTSGGTVTRVQDQYSKTGISNLINSEEGVLFVEMAALANDSTNRQLKLSDGTDTNRIVLKYDNQSNVIQCFNRVNGVETATLSATVSDITQFSKIAIKWKLNDYALWIDGFEVDTDNPSTTFPSSTLSELTFGTSSALYARVKQLQVFKTTDIDLAALTS